MADSSELTEILDDLKSDGRVDSEGDFTLNATAAKEKLGRSVQSMPERAIYYFLQAGVACQALSIRLTLPRHKVRVQIQLPESDLTFQEPATLVNPPTGSHTALQCLSMGMLWFSTWPAAYSTIEYVTPYGGYRIRSDSEEFEELEPFDGPKELRFQLSLPAIQTSETAAILMRLVVSLQRGLGEAFGYSPVPIIMDARQLPAGENLVQLARDNTYRGYLMYRQLVLCSQNDRGCLAAAPPTQWPAQKVLLGGQPWPHPTDLEAMLGKLELAGELTAPVGPTESHSLVIDQRFPAIPLAYDPYLLHQSRPLRCRALFYRVRETGAILYIVHHGLLLHPVPLMDLSKQSGGWTIVVATRELNTDFLGTQVIQDNKFKAILDWVYSKLASIYRG